MTENQHECDSYISQFSNTVGNTRDKLQKKKKNNLNVDHSLEMLVHNQVLLLFPDLQYRVVNTC